MPGTTTKTFVCRQTNGDGASVRDGAGVIFVAKVAMIPQSRFSQIWLQANYIYIYILYFWLYISSGEKKWLTWASGVAL